MAVIYALVSAALFGLSTPAAKALLGSVSPFVLAGLLYLGAGIGIALLRRWGRRLFSEEKSEIPLGRSDLPWLAGAVIAGGIAGPLLLLAGLALTDAATASLLLTLEGAATALLAWFVVGENFSRRVFFGMTCLLAGALVLSWSGRPTAESLAGPALVALACLAWAIDNNLTRRVSLADPLQIVEIKGLVAGPFNLALGFSLGAPMPGFPAAMSAGIVGFLGYGLSLVLFVFALRHLGAARTAAYFSTAPFIGALAAVVAMQQPVTWQLVGAGALMAFGTWLHLSERHEHEHTHEPMSHAHPHVHDEHHQHSHSANDPPGEPHTHWHEHGRLTHSHPHFPDMHHTHRH